MSAFSAPVCAEANSSFGLFPGANPQAPLRIPDVTTYLRKTGLRCIVRPEGGQWVLLVIDSGGYVVAAVPSDFDLGQTHPLGSAWAWRTGRHLEWVRLEDS